MRPLVSSLTTDVEVSNIKANQRSPVPASLAGYALSLPKVSVGSRTRSTRLVRPGAIEDYVCIKQLTHQVVTDVEYFNWSVAEAGLCIITGSIPALRPLLATILPRSFGSYNMDDFVETVKDTVNRVATRPGSRSRSRAGSRAESRIGSRMDHRRRSSEGTISSLPGDLRDHSYNEIDSPKTEGARSLSAKLPAISTMLGSVSSLAMRASCSLIKILRRRGPRGDEERGRSRLSVINELDEVTSARENEKHKRSRFASRIPDLSASVADCQWWWARSHLNPWSSKRPADDPTPGVVIIMTEVMVTSGKREQIQSHHGYPV